MKVMFVVKTAFLRNFWGVLREFQERGHEVTILTEKADKGRGRSKSFTKLIENPLGGPRIPMILSFASPKRSAWLTVQKGIRNSQYYLNYLRKEFDEFEFVRRRMLAQTNKSLRARLPCSREEHEKDPVKAKELQTYLSDLENSFPIYKAAFRILLKEKPDAVMVSPLIFPTSQWQLDHVKAAQLLGIPVVHPVFSWDNLSTKGSYIVKPDVVMVWNERQAEEAHVLHDIPRERTAVTGAYRFDDFLRLKPASREAYAQKYGLDPTKKTILFLGSSPLCAPREGEFVRLWLDALRKSDLDIRNANVIFRPHPRNLDAWRDTGVPGVERRVAEMKEEVVEMWCSQSLHDDVSFCDVVVGVNTSGMIEAALLGKPVCGLLFEDKLMNVGPDVKHYEFLANAERGLLHIAKNIDEHFDQIQHLLSRSEQDARTASFVRDFVYPLGKPGVPVFVDTFESVLKQQVGRRKIRYGQIAKQFWSSKKLATKLRAGALPLGKVDRKLLTAWY